MHPGQFDPNLGTGSKRQVQYYSGNHLLNVLVSSAPRHIFTWLLKIRLFCSFIRMNVVRMLLSQTRFFQCMVH